MAPRKPPTKRSAPLPKGKGKASEETPDINQIITEQLSAAMPNLISQVSASIMQTMGGSGNGTGSGTKGDGGSGAGGSGAGGSCTGGSGAGGGGVVILDENLRGCSHKTFMGCKPLDFHGTEGAVGVLKWIEKTEAVCEISGCSNRDRVKYATSTFQGKALTWWNTEIRVRGRETINTMTWEQLQEILIVEYCPKNEIQKIEAEFWELQMKGSDIQGYTNRFYEMSQLVPHMVTPESKSIDRYIWGLAPEIRGMVTSARPNTLQSAIILAGTLTDEMVRNGSLPKHESRKERSRKRWRHDDKEDSRKKSNSGKQAGQTYAETIPDRSQYKGAMPKCNKCSYHHAGDCRYCEKCKKLGHTEKYCKATAVGCFECGSPDHFKKNCPKLNRNAGKETNPARGRAYVMGVQEARQDPKVVTGN